MINEIIYRLMETRKHENFEKYLDIFTMIVDHPMLNNGDALPKPLPNQRMDIGFFVVSTKVKYLRNGANPPLSNVSNLVVVPYLR